MALDEGVRIQIGNKKISLRKGSSILVKQGAKHRLECEGGTAVRILEISFGHFSESDIVRYEDIYGRVSERVSSER